MKKIKMYVLVMIISIMAIATGNPVDASSSTKKLEKQISQLKKENDLLKKKNKEYRDWEKGLKSPDGLMKTIKVLEYPENKVQFYKDAQKLFPSLSNGSSFRTYLIDDQLYAPIEAVGKSLYGTSKDVTWDKTRKGVYFGEKPTGTVTSMDEIPLIDNSQLSIRTGSKSEFNLYTKKVSPKFSLTGWGGDVVFYELNKNYASLNAKYAVPYSYLGQKLNSRIEFYSLNSYGEEKFLGSVDSKAGDDQLYFDLDIKGVEYLKIRFVGDTSVLYNYSLTGLKF